MPNKSMISVSGRGERPVMAEIHPTYQVLREDDSGRRQVRSNSPLAMALPGGPPLPAQAMTMPESAARPASTVL
jgi:hypothetical protein